MPETESHPPSTAPSLSRRARAGVDAEPPHRPADTPAIRRHIERHPDAAALDADALTEHAYQQARRHLDSIQHRIEEYLADRGD